jgi:hypothetical protein
MDCTDHSRTTSVKSRLEQMPGGFNGPYGRSVWLDEAAIFLAAKGEPEQIFQVGSKFKKERKRKKFLDLGWRK